MLSGPLIGGFFGCAGVLFFAESVLLFSTRFGESARHALNSRTVVLRRILERGIQTYLVFRRGKVREAAGRRAAPRPAGFPDLH